ncbi:hypothetical protein Hypma_013127 [Hypsizygus marmoreus]|uniref:Uncharacterized protein n=1 Tax=Hypsizygus marmoreus TaxID=39966 RepID=A0A369JD75_HYPMA|nr:hypothetical protein Hypma_013127 [Hypsizygus marmoreus]
MDTVSDPELASEMVNLLGRELKVARKRIEKLEREPQALNHRVEELEQEIAELRRHSAVIEEAHKVDIERTRAAEFALSALKLDITKKGSKNRVSTPTFQKEDIKLKLEDKVKEEQKEPVDVVEKRVGLEKELAEAKEKYGKQRDAKRTLRQTFAEQQATLEQLLKEKETLLYQVKDLQEWQDAATGMKTRLEQAESQKEALQQNESSHVERIRVLECDLDKMKEKYRAQKEAKSHLRQECGELEARLKTTGDEKAALERQMKAQEDPRQLYLTTEAQLQELEAEKGDLALQHTAQVTKIESLEKKLRKLTETKKSQCEANVSLQEKLDESERQLKELTQENETFLRHLVQESQRAARDHSAVSLASILKSRQMFYNSKEFNQFLNHLPIPAVRPDYRFLLPIGARDTKISLYLARDPSLLPYSQTYIRFSEVIRWDSSKCHAVAFGPLSPHDGDQGSYFSNLHGQTRELFFESEKQLYYAGTYRCLPTKGWSGEGALLPPDMRIEGILDQVGADTTTHPTQLSKIMYRDGSLRVDCMVLQCVDFNHALYNRFLQYFEEFVLRKRKLLHAAKATPRKKQKMVE